MNINGNALVVGGGGGIGRACVVQLAREGASAILVADLAIEAARDALAEAQAVATHPMFQGKAVPLDVTREESVRNIFNEMVSAFGRIDYCINCAGIGAQQTTDIASLSLAEFQRFLDLNTTGMFLVTREASIAMRAQEPRSVSASEPARGLSRGTIVNLASASSLVATTGVLPYTTSKHAVLGLTKNSALDNVSHNIRVNCICPSWVETPMVKKAMEGVEGLAEIIEAAVPMGRIATPEEVADVVIFMCSPRSSYMTGSALVVDGGTTLTAMR